MNAMPSQEYFWSHDWQAAEARASDDLAAGRSASFEHSRDAICWLLSDDDTLIVDVAP